MIRLILEMLKTFSLKIFFEASDYIIDRLAVMFDKERKLKNNYRTVVFTVPKDLIWPSNKPF